MDWLHVELGCALPPRASIASLVREAVERDPCLWYCMREGIVNLSAAARRISSRIEEEWGLKPSLAAVKMALSRLARSRGGGGLGRIARVLAGSTLVIQDRVAVVTTGREALPRLLSEARLWEARFLQVTQSLRAASIVVSEEDLDRILEATGGGEVLRGQAALIMISPPEIVSTPGVVALITSYLDFHGINITQIISCSTDTIIVLDSGRATEAFKALHTLIQSMSGLAGAGGEGEAPEGQ